MDLKERAVFDVLRSQTLSPCVSSTSGSASVATLAPRQHNPNRERERERLGEKETLIAAGHDRL